MTESKPDTLPTRNTTLLDVVPPTIVALDAFEDLLAIARRDGSVEVVRYSNATVGRLGGLAGRDDFTIRRVVWMRRGRVPAVPYLVVAGLNAQILVIDPSNFNTTAVQHSHGGAVWDVKRDPTEESIAVCTSDGCCRLFALDEAGRLALQSTISISAKDIKCTACEFTTGRKHPSIVIGGNNGYVSHYTLSEKREEWTSDLNTNRKKFHRGRVETVIWAITQLDEETLAVGTSNSSVYLVQIANGVQLKMLDTHRADILQIVRHPKGHQAYSIGIDGRVARLVAAGRGQWAVQSKRKIQNADVLAMCILTEKSQTTLAFGGIDSHVTLMNTEFDTKSFTSQISFNYPWRPFATPLAVSAIHAADGSPQTFAVDGPLQSVRGWLFKPGDPTPAQLFTYTTRGKWRVQCCDVQPEGQAFVYSTPIAAGYVPVYWNDQRPATAGLMELNKRVCSKPSDPATPAFALGDRLVLPFPFRLVSFIPPASNRDQSQTKKRKLDTRVSFVVVDFQNAVHLLWRLENGEFESKKVKMGHEALIVSLRASHTLISAVDEAGFIHCHSLYPEHITVPRSPQFARAPDSVCITQTESGEPAIVGLLHGREILLYRPMAQGNSRSRRLKLKSKKQYFGLRLQGEGRLCAVFHAGGAVLLDLTYLFAEDEGVNREDVDESCTGSAVDIGHLTPTDLVDCTWDCQGGLLLLHANQLVRTAAAAPHFNKMEYGT